MRISEYYKLDRTQPYLDFVDVYLNTDIPVFVNPAAIRGLNSTWGSECVSLLQHFFESLLKRIKAGDKNAAVSLLSSLSEKNEFHLGYSKGKSRGHAFGQKSGTQVWKALSESKAAKSSLLSDLEDTCLMIEGIGPDMVSDAICNIIRGPLLKYTEEMCRYYGIPLEPDVNSGSIWNPHEEQWETKLISLPVTKKYGKLVFVPKIIVRYGMWYAADEYYRHYLLPAMQQDEIEARSALVQTLKDGRKRVTKKSLIRKYGHGKSAIVEQTLKRPEILERYKQVKGQNVPKPLSHGDFAEIERIETPDWIKLLENIEKIPVGNDTAGDYEDSVEKLLSALFYPSLCSPQKQHKIHDGRKRIDITYVNAANRGFFAWLSQHYSAAHVFVECKNYGKEVGNPAIDQLSGRFSPSRGAVGILICRHIDNKKTLLKRCIDTAKDSRGYIIALDDEDIAELVNEYLRRLFNKLIM